MSPTSTYRVGESELSPVADDQVRILMEMLSLPTWREEPLTLHFFSSSHLELQCGGPPLPAHMRVDVAPMEVSTRHTISSLCDHTSCHFCLG